MPETLDTHRLRLSADRTNGPAPEGMLDCRPMPDLFVMHSRSRPGSAYSIHVSI